MTRGTTDWTSVITDGSSTVTDTFPLAYKNMNQVTMTCSCFAESRLTQGCQAILAIELDGVTWDFGQLVWNDVVMVMNTTETAWCTE